MSNNNNINNNIPSRRAEMSSNNNSPVTNSRSTKLDKATLQRKLQESRQARTPPQLPSSERPNSRDVSMSSLGRSVSNMNVNPSSSPVVSNSNIIVPSPSISNILPSSNSKILPSNNSKILNNPTTFVERRRQLEELQKSRINASTGRNNNSNNSHINQQLNSTKSPAAISNIKQSSKLRQSVLLDPSKVFGNNKNDSDEYRIIREESNNNVYKPIPTEYKNALVYVVKELDSEESEPEKTDFITEEGYYGWLDQMESSGMPNRLSWHLLQMLQHWDTCHPLLHTSNNNTSNNNTSNNNSTSVNLLVRIVEGRNLPKDGKEKNRNWFCTIKNTQSSKTFETEVISDCSDPVWNQQIALTITNITDVIEVCLYYQKEKSGLFTDDVKEGFMGSVQLNVQSLITKTAKQGFHEEWFPLGESSNRKLAKMNCTGELLIEVELGGVNNNNDNTPNNNVTNSLHNVQGLLIGNKVNLKAIFTILMKALVRLDLCVGGRQSNIMHVKLKNIPWQLSSASLQVMQEFMRIWSISRVYGQMQLMECVFEEYKNQHCHIRALLSAYRGLYEGIWKSESIWLPNYEKPRLHQLMSLIEVYLTSQILNFKEFFPLFDTSIISESDQLEQIKSTIDCVLYLTRMIDKNPFFQSELQMSSSNDGNSNTDNMPNSGISELDYKNGKFSFTEKIRGLVHNRALQSYQKISEQSEDVNSNEHNSSTNSLQKLVNMCELMDSEVEDFRRVYAQGFKQEIDLIEVFVEVFTKYFILEMSTMILNNNASNNVSNNASNNDTNSVGLSLILKTFEMRSKWMKYSPKLKFPINESEWFTPIINNWLNALQSQSIQWIENIHSNTSSNNTLSNNCVTDIFSAFHQSLAQLQSTLSNWPHNSQFASFFTRFASIVWKALDHYCDLIRVTINNTSNSSTSSNVLEWLGRKKSLESISNNNDTLINRLCGVISSIEDILRRLEPLYDEMNGQEILKLTSNWRQERFNRDNNNRDKKLLIGGLLDLQVICAKELKQQKFGLISTTNCIFIQVDLTNIFNTVSDTSNTSLSNTSQSNTISQSNTTVGKTLTISNSLNPKFGYLNPNIPSSNNNSHILLDSPSWLAAVEEGLSLQIKVFNQPQQSTTLSSLLGNSSSDPQLMGLAELHLSKDFLNTLTRQQTSQHWLQLDTQGQVLLNMTFVPSRLHLSLETSSLFGRYGMEDLDFVFNSISRSLHSCRYSLVNYLIDRLLSSSVYPLINRIISDNSSTLTHSPTLQEVDVLVEPVMNIMDDLLASISQLLSDRMTQHVIFQMWRQYLLPDLLHRLNTSSCPFNQHLNSNLSDYQKDLIRIFIGLLKEFFYAGGEGLGIDKRLLEDCSNLCPGCSISI